MNSIVYLLALIACVANYGFAQRIPGIPNISEEDSKILRIPGIPSIDGGGSKVPKIPGIPCINGGSGRIPYIPGIPSYSGSSEKPETTCHRGNSNGPEGPPRIQSIPDF